MVNIIRSNIFKNFFIILLLISLTLGFSKSYTSYTIDNLDFVTSIGIDVSETDDTKLKISFEFTKASNYSPEYVLSFTKCTPYQTAA